MNGLRIIDKYGDRVRFNPVGENLFVGIHGTETDEDSVEVSLTPPQQIALRDYLIERQPLDVVPQADGVERF